MKMRLRFWVEIRSWDPKHRKRHEFCYRRFIWRESIKRKSIERWERPKSTSKSIKWKSIMKRTLSIETWTSKHVHRETIWRQSRDALLRPVELKRLRIFKRRVWIKNRARLLRNRLRDGRKLERAQKHRWDADRRVVWTIMLVLVIPRVSNT